MTEEAIEDGAGDHGVGEHLIPELEALVDGDDRRLLFVTVRSKCDLSADRLALPLLPPVEFAALLGEQEA